MTVKLFTRFGQLLHVEQLHGLIVVPDLIHWQQRFFARDFNQMTEWQRYTEVSVHEIKES